VPKEIPKRIYSVLEFLSAPSAIFEAIDTADLVI